MPRLFTGLKIPPDIVTRLSFLQGGLRGARWSDGDDYHVTLRFIGDVEGHVADEISDGLVRVSHRPFELSISGLGCFGTKKPHSVWAGVSASQDLTELQAQHERVVQRAGLPPEGRKYTPHITLARVRGLSPAAIAEWLAMRGDFGPIGFSVNEFVLYSARASTGGGPYVVEETYALAGSDGEAAVRPHHLPS